MLQVKRAKKFLKDMEKVKRGSKESTFQRIESRLGEVIDCLANNRSLDKSFMDHALYNCKVFTDCRECHILGDLVLVYKLQNDSCQLLALMRIGNHNEILEKLTKQSKEN